MSTDFSKKYLDPKYWNPKNVEIIDWDKFYATNPKVPEVFDPPQKKNMDGCLYAPLWWWNRSCLGEPCPSILHSCCGFHKPHMDRISNGDSLFNKLLKAETTSQSTPEPLRNHLFWTKDNIAPETLLNLSTFAWREQTEESKVIGVGELVEALTSNPSCLGYLFAYLNSRTTMIVQGSPDGKWFCIAGLNEVTEQCSYIYIYIVQEGDEFRTTEGEVIDDVKPGDCVRISWGDQLNPYETDNSKITYHYFLRRVASINEEGQLELNTRHYADLLKVATSDASDKCCETCCFTFTCCTSAEERFDFQVNHVSDKQYFKMVAAPPTAEEIERALGNGEDDFNDNPKASKYNSIP